jgi:DNA-binding NtrC family response regulator
VLVGCDPARGPDQAEILRRLDARPWVCVLATREKLDARGLMRAATEFIEAPWSHAELAIRFERFADRIGAAQRQLDETRAGMEIVGDAPAFRDALATAQKFAASPAPVFVEGETGTGKELFARLIHRLGERQQRPFVPVNCGCLPRELVENELFGHEAGAFTGAARAALGLVHQAEGGTLFLDEVDALPLRAQVALLRFLQEREVRPVGAGRLRKVDVRVIAASNRPLAALVEAGTFREDLYFRLNVLTLALPPLRQRRCDIADLARHFLDRLAADYARPAMWLSDPARDWLMAQDLPGNVRQLENLLHRAVLKAAGARIELADIAPPGTPVPPPAPPVGIEPFAKAKARAVTVFERRYLTGLMQDAGGNVTAAAERAGKERRALGRLLKKHGIGPHWTRPEDRLG